jgi:hypothetical protein
MNKPNYQVYKKLTFNWLVDNLQSGFIWLKTTASLEGSSSADDGCLCVCSREVKEKKLVSSTVRSPLLRFGRHCSCLFILD